MLKIVHLDQIKFNIIIRPVATGGGGHFGAVPPR